jgi:hypothetical protein
MADWLNQHLSEILSAIGGAIGGSFLTLQLMRNRVQGSGTVIDQSKARAHGDIIGGNKNAKSGRR